MFDPARLTQARQLAGLTKTALAQHVGVKAAAVGQWESSTTPPRPDHLTRVAEVLEVPIGFFALGRPYARLDASDRCLRRRNAHARSLHRAAAAQSPGLPRPHRAQSRLGCISEVSALSDS
ncbi:helix-turn-helix domain-containing protein [Actinomadura oligospora]|uniref:helix-turn-helix domain-containing protein n=1 Tax=Actinomadura oligospora TaxID=111804 RepID=UPI003CCBD3F2